MRFRRGGLIARLFVMLAVPVIASASGLWLQVADIAAPDFSARGIRVTLPENGSADFQLASLTVQQREFYNVRLHCGEFTLTSARVACGRGRLDLMPDAALNFDYAFDEKRLKLALSAKSGESWQISGQSGAWQVQLHKAQLRRLAPFFPPEIPLPAEGILNGSLDIGDFSARADLQLAEVSFSSGPHAAEKLCGDIRFSARQSGAGWNWQGSIDWLSGELYWQPLYLKGGHQLVGSGRINDKRLSIDAATALLPEVGRVAFSAEWQEGSLVSGALHGTGLALDKLFEVYAKPFLDKGLLVESSLQGVADVDAQYRGGALQSLKLKLTEAGIADAEKRFSLFGVSSDLNWQANVPGSFEIVFAGGSLLGAPIGKGLWKVRTDGYKYDVTQASLPILDGRLDLRDFHLHRMSDAWHWNFSAVLLPISMEQLSLAAGWPKMLGTLSGRVPNVSFDGNEIYADGALLFNVFDGTVVATGLKLSDAFGRVPRLSGTLVMRNLDLDMLTRTFAFGSMLGRIDGDINALQLQNWQPVKFDAHLYSSKGNYPRKISQNAVQNISSLGGEGAAAAIQRSYLRFFENFGYERIGIRCLLRNDLCQMGGIEEGNQGSYAIIRGGGIPAISVIGYNRAVSWNELISRLRRVTQDEVKPFVK